MATPKKDKEKEAKRTTSFVREWITSLSFHANLKLNVSVYYVIYLLFGNGINVRWIFLCYLPLHINNYSSSYSNAVVL